jgi:hypothetical protein
VTEKDNGKVLSVVNGSWQSTAVPGLPIVLTQRQYNYLKNNPDEELHIDNNTVIKYEADRIYMIIQEKEEPDADQYLIL